MPTTTSATNESARNPTEIAHYMAVHLHLRMCDRNRMLISRAAESVGSSLSVFADRDCDEPRRRVVGDAIAAAR
jgi:hypothetical protein